MNVLLIGSSTELMNELIKKLSKEGHRISILTGSYYSEEKYEHVFERYDFPYTCESIQDIFTSIEPDLTICTGAFDRNFSWGGDSQESVHFVSSHLSILSAHAALRRGRFLFLSSDAVFDERNAAPRTEASPSDADTLYGTAVAQVENLCRFFQTQQGTDIVLVRVNGFFCLPASPREADSEFSRLCLEALRDRRLTVTPSRTVSLLDVQDTVQFVSQIALAPELRYNFYQLSSGQEIGEAQLAGMIQSAAAKLEAALPEKAPRREPVQIIEKSSQFKQLRVVLDNERFRTEFGIRRINSLEKDIDAQLQHMQAHSDIFLPLQKEEPSVFSRFLKLARRVLRSGFYLMENLLCYGITALLTELTRGVSMFERLDFYLLYVLLFAILYGQRQAVVSAFLVTAGYLFRQLSRGGVLGILIDYSVYAWIAEIFITAMAVGYLKDGLSRQIGEAEDDHRFMSLQLKDIREINDSNVRVKSALQAQIVNQTDSIGKIYEITSSLDQYSSDEVLFYAADMLRRIMGTDEVAIYMISKGPFARMLTATSENARRLGNSIKYVEIPEMYASLSARKVFINRALNENLPMMASMIYEGDDPRLIIMIWTLPWEKMTLGQANLLTVTGALIQNAVLRANRYLEALHGDRFISDTPILQEDAFLPMLHAYENAAHNHLTQFRVLEILCGEQDPLTVGTAISGIFRPNDYLTERADGRLMVLLSNTNNVGANAVINRIAQKGYQAVMLPEYAQN